MRGDGDQFLFCDTMKVAFFLHRGPLIRSRRGGLRQVC